MPQQDYQPERERSLIFLKACVLQDFHVSEDVFINVFLYCDAPLVLESLGVLCVVHADGSPQPTLVAAAMRSR